MPKLSLGIVGAGCIGRTVARAFAGPDSPLELTTIAELDEDRARELIHDCAPDARLLPIEKLSAEVDIVLESAAASVVPDLVNSCRESAVICGLPGHLVVMSVGGLLEVETARPALPVIHVPSGALGGLDAIQAMKEAGLEEVLLTTTKPPAGLGVETDEPLVLYEGPAAEVVRRYPKNINVAMALSLAGLGPQLTRVKLVADPGTDANTHHVIARGVAGVVEFTSINRPFPENPRTSYLAAMSAIAILRRIAAPLQVG